MPPMAEKTGDVKINLPTEPKKDLKKGQVLLIIF
jgi:hypothetical protein